MEFFFEALERRCACIQSYLCVGLDPHLSLLKEEERNAQGALAASKRVVEQSHDHAACYKINSAFFEQFGGEGYSTMKELIEFIHSIPVHGEYTRIPVILDCKRGDISTTAEAYANASYNYLDADAVTLSPYMGKDSIDPFLRNGKGVFVLCKTSNPTASELQEIITMDGRKIYEKIAEMVGNWNMNLPNPTIGIVMGATDVQALKSVIKNKHIKWILCPGVGTQGGDLEELCKVVKSSNDATQLLVTISRQVFFAENVKEISKHYQEYINKILASVSDSTSSQHNYDDVHQQYKSSFIQEAISSNALKFGTFQLKSGRISPYFFNSSSLYHGKSFLNTCRSYAQLIHENVSNEFDIFFGPAYKGITLCAGVAMMYYQLYGESKEIVFNRKEAKDHGEKGLLLGANSSEDLQGKRVIIIDDVITAGTAIREASDLLRSHGAVIAGVAVLLDRMEVTNNSLQGEARLSAIQEISLELSFPVFSICNINDILRYLKTTEIQSELIDAIEHYRAQYGIIHGNA